MLAQPLLHNFDLLDGDRVLAAQVGPAGVGRARRAGGRGARARRAGAIASPPQSIDAARPHRRARLGSTGGKTFDAIASSAAAAKGRGVEVSAAAGAARRSDGEASELGVSRPQRCWSGARRAINDFTFAAMTAPGFRRPRAAQGRPLSRRPTPSVAARSASTPSRDACSGSLRRIAPRRRVASASRIHSQLPRGRRDAGAAARTVDAADRASSPRPRLVVVAAHRC